MIVKNIRTSSGKGAKNALTWDEVLAAPGVERVKDDERHLDGWLVRYESPGFRTDVILAVNGAAAEAATHVGIAVYGDPDAPTVVE